MNTKHNPESLCILTTEAKNDPATIKCVQLFDGQNFFCLGERGAWRKKTNKTKPQNISQIVQSVYPALVMFVKSVTRNPTIPKGNTLIHIMLNLISYTYYSNLQNG